MSTIFIDDIAISNPDQDEIGRKTLVEVVVEAIRHRASSQHPSICFGIYGEWGEGKTSFMRMVETAIRSDNNIDVLWFDPWNIVSPEKMVVEFFSSLSRLSSANTDDLSLAISSYGKAFLASVDATESPEVSSYLERLSHCIPGGTELKDYISQELVDHNKHLVFFIDDLDRLQASEIRMVFKLIRQIADFKNVIYVIGVDSEVVSIALGEPYGNKRIGRDFLKKIVQIPVVLPPIQDSRLQLVFGKRFTPVLRDCKHESSEQEIDKIGKKLIGALHSIRDINRFINQLSLIFPVLHEETELNDLCLIESLKFLNEQGWLSVYHNMDALLFSNRPPVRVKEEMDVRYDSAIRDILSFFSDRDKAYVNDILRNHLFKKLHQVDPVSKSICNEVYFRQYFTCGVPDGVVPHIDLLSFKKRIDEKDIQGALNWLNSHAVLYSSAEMERVARTTLYLNQKVSRNTEDAAYLVSLALAYSRLSDGFGMNTIQNKNTIDTTIGCVIIPYFLGKYDETGFTVNKQRESLLLKEIFERCALNFCMNLLHAVHSKYGVVPVDEAVSFNVLRDRILETGLLKAFEYSYVIKQVFFKVWRDTDSDGFNQYLRKVLLDKEFDVGIEISNWLEAAGEKDELQQIMYLSEIYNPVIDLVQLNLSHSSRKADPYVKKFLANRSYSY